MLAGGFKKSHMHTDTHTHTHTHSHNARMMDLKPPPPPHILQESILLKKRAGAQLPLPMCKETHMLQHKGRMTGLKTNTRSKRGFKKRGGGAEAKTCCKDICKDNARMRFYTHSQCWHGGFPAPALPSHAKIEEAKTHMP